jgi:hypothetical protein
LGGFIEGAGFDAAAADVPERGPSRVTSILEPGSAMGNDPIRAAFRRPSGTLMVSGGANRWLRFACAPAKFRCPSGAGSGIGGGLRFVLPGWAGGEVGRTDGRAALADRLG